MVLYPGCRQRLPMCWRAGPGLSAPEATKEVAMPAQQRFGLDDEQALAPGAQPAGEQDQQRPVGSGAARPLDAASQDDQLLSEQGILGDVLWLAADKVIVPAMSGAVTGL